MTETQTNQFLNLIDNTAAFIAALEEETATLKEQKINRATNFLAHKHNLWLRQQQVLEAISEQAWQEIEPATKETLLQQFELLKEVLEENYETLDGASRVQQYLIDVIVDGMKQQQAPICFYTKDKKPSLNTCPVSISAFDFAV